MRSEIVERLNETERKAVITLSVDEVEVAYEAAECEVKKLKMRPLGTKQLGGDSKAAEQNAIATRATRLLAEESCRQVIEARKDRITANPKIDIKALAQKGQDFTFEALYAVVPEFELGMHREIRVSVSADLEVTDNDINERLSIIQQRSAKEKHNSKSVISSVDEVKLSFESFIDGKEYEGSSVEHFSYKMGSEDLPSAFELGLTGMRAGESKSIKFVIPEDFGNEFIAGKHARFDIRVESVTSRFLPELTDEFAKSFGYENLDDWRMKIRADIVQEKRNIYEMNCEKRAREELALLLQGDIPQEMITSQTYRLLEAFKQELSQQQISFEQYCQFLSVTEEDIRREMKENAETMLKENLALESLFRLLDIEITDKELSKTAEVATTENNMSEPLLLDSMTSDQRGAIYEMTMHRIATEWLLENAIFVNEDA